MALCLESGVEEFWRHVAWIWANLGRIHWLGVLVCKRGNCLLRI